MVRGYCYGYVFLYWRLHNRSKSPKSFQNNRVHSGHAARRIGAYSQEFSSTREMSSYIREKFSPMSVNPAWLQTSQICYQHFDWSVCIIKTPTVTQVEFLAITTLSESQLRVNCDLRTLQALLSTAF